MRCARAGGYGTASLGRSSFKRRLSKRRQISLESTLGVRTRTRNRQRFPVGAGDPPNAGASSSPLRCVLADDRTLASMPGAVRHVQSESLKARRLVFRASSHPPAAAADTRRVVRNQIRKNPMKNNLKPCLTRAPRRSRSVSEMRSVNASPNDAFKANQHG